MKKASTTTHVNQRIEHHLTEVGLASQNALAQTPAASVICSPSALLLNQGKMLRSRLALRLALADETASEGLIKACAALELVHTASLLHDDVIDGGALRRGSPAFWQEKGIAGAIILGDLYLFQALKLLQQCNNPRWVNQFVDCIGEVCEAESRQEFLLKQSITTWDDAAISARQKTGPLFGFAAYIAAGDDTDAAKMLMESGFLLGTAFQLADDYMDAYGTTTDKSLQLDAMHHKGTAATAGEKQNVLSAIEQYIHQARINTAAGSAWRTALNDYIDNDFIPVIQRFTSDSAIIPPAG